MAKQFKLRHNAPEFTATDGRFAGRTFRRGKVYDAVPEADKHRFEAVKPPATKATKATKATARKTENSEVTDEISQSES